MSLGSASRVKSVLRTRGARLSVKNRRVALWAAGRAKSVQSNTTLPWTTVNPANRGAQSSRMARSGHLKMEAIKTVQIHLQLGKRSRELVAFDLALDRTLRGCDLAHPCVRNSAHGDQIGSRAMMNIGYCRPRRPAAAGLRAVGFYHRHEGFKARETNSAKTKSITADHEDESSPTDDSWGPKS